MSVWKTGKPEKDGEYIVKYKAGYGPVKNDVDRFSVEYGKWYWHDESVIKWTEIPEDKPEEHHTAGGCGWVD